MAAALAQLVACGAADTPAIEPDSHHRALELPPAAGPPPLACAVPFASYDAFIDSLATEPADPLDAAPTRAQLEAAYPEPAFVALQAGDGRCLAFPDGGHVLRPRPVPGTRWPVVVFLRDGLEQQDRLRFGDLVELAGLAERGYLVLAPEYGSPAASDELGGAENERITAWIEHSALQPDAESDGWLVWGVSRGAVNALQLARERRDVAAVAITSGLFDMQAVLAARPELESTLRAGIPDFDADREAALRARSPLRWASELAAPTLLIHGSDDRRLDIAQARRFATMHGELLELRDGHALGSHRTDVLDAIDRFFRRHRLPPVPLDHLYVVLDAETHAALRTSRFLLEEFAAVDAGLPHFRPVGPDADVLYVRGAETYLELMGPQNHFGEPVGQIGLGFGVEVPGSLPRVFASLRAAGLRPFFSSDYVDFAGPVPIPWKQTTGPRAPLVDGLAVWASEYAPGFAHWLDPRSAGPRAIARSDFLRPRSRGDRLLADIIGVRLGVDPAARQTITDGLLALGYEAQGGGEVLTEAGLEISLQPENGPTRLLTVTFRLTRAASCDLVLGVAHLQCMGDRAELRLGPAQPAPSRAVP
ncbi:Alpha/beta hydrolase family protein [Nannocystis exedens]|uniref:Alpha/beta hydrolase family protein n=1 Tax=Nannocystis exedens TaxID=54 RepID=A0A1I2HNX8_9BACT|nr:DUF5829 family protein [Nannocystis exedens]PCC69355.1 Alpha/beta hydrolase family protein [Nannocystis exedens]SFF31123.1 Alpha/beta hydrolase family protein [Nannocystis exedens]